MPEPPSAAAASRAAARRAAQQPPRGFRPDVEGLRAVAVLLVLAYHAGLPWASGGYVGVDVFFVISGFLITGLLVKELRSTGRVSLARFYARRARRLLPASAVVLAATAVLTVVALPATRWSGVAGDLLASTAYVMNWRLAASATDYLAADDAASPLQHFWSLGVEEQFYLVWPVLLLAVTWWARRTGRPLGPPLVGGLLLLAVPSLWWSSALTAADPGAAYFVTTTRVWELGLGGLLALAGPRLARLPAAAAHGAGAVGVAAVLWAGVAFDGATPFPGTAALVPTVGAALVVAAGVAGHRTPVARLLSTAPMTWVGRLSYVLYLWHWPLVVAAVALWGDRLAVTVAAVVVSVLPAWLTHVLVEEPLRRSRSLAVPRRAVGVAAAVLAVGVLAAGGVRLAVPSVPAAAQQGIVPDPLVASDDVPVLYADDCHTPQDEVEPRRCAYGDLDGPRVVLAGDSHAAQWLPALRAVAEDRGWRLEVRTKSACPFADLPVTLPDGADYPQCAQWNERLLAELTGPDRPDLLVTTNQLAYQVPGLGDADPDAARATSRQALREGLRRTWQQVTAAGVPVVVLVDTPRPGFDVPECVVENREDPGECAVPREQAVTDDVHAAAAAGLDDVQVVDLTDDICPGQWCQPVRDGLLVYRDSHHLTATFAATLTPLLAERLPPRPGSS